ncbi:MAG: PRTRC system protein B [Sphingobacteriia bacterium]|jgi:PRTRC genetic system protein B|nr:PRTRC system protein B [Sphingobacteriia bacterium]
MGLCKGSIAGVLNPASRPTGALVFHEASSGLDVTYHTVTGSDGGARIGPGRAMTVADTEALLEALKGTRAKERQWIAPDLLAQGEQFLAWRVPGRVRPMWFVSGKERICLDVPWPDLVFAATDNRISLAALATRGRPRLGTRIYHAPLFNVYESGAVCLGSAQVGEMLGTQSIPAFEDAIFGSLFSHGNFRGNLARSHDGGVTSDADHLRFWRALSRDHVPVFPTDALVPMKTTLGAFLGLGGRR